MEIKYGKHINSNDLSEKEIDLFLLAGNHEKRVFTAYENYVANNDVSKAIVLCYNASFDLPKNKSAVEKLVINDHTRIYSLLDVEFSKIDKEHLLIVVDYSCMTKAWYYSIILYLSKRNLKFKKITAYFTYTPSKYSIPLEPKPNTEIAPLPGKYIVTADKPKALIVCLGYEQNKAEGIIEHLDPKISYILYTKPALDDEFVKKLESNNISILENNCNNVITFPFDDLLYLERRLTALYYLLRSEYSIIIAPLGPKPFTFISMLMAVKYPDIDIWRVGSGSDINEYDREPINANLFILYEVVFE